MISDHLGSLLRDEVAMPEINDEADRPDVPGSQGDPFRVVVEDHNGAVTDGGDNPRPEKEDSNPVGRGMD